MSLDRFANKEEIKSHDGAIHAIKWTKEIVDRTDLQLLPHTIGSEDTKVEVHLYSKSDPAVYIDSIYGIQHSVANAGGLVSINLSQIAAAVDIVAGKFNVIYNFHTDRVGNVDNPAFYIEEISPDRTELYIRSIFGSSQPIKNAREEYLNDLSTAVNLRDGNLVINFGRGEVYTIVQQGSWTHPDGVRLKLLKPLRHEIIEGQTAWIAVETADPFTDDIEFITEETSDTVQIRQANFDVETEYSTITETDFKNWNELLGSNVSTSQKIVDNLFSGSLAGVNLGIDYSKFENFVHFSSAKERVANFKYKLQLIEFYNQQLSQLASVSGDDTGSLQNSISLNRGRRDNIIGTFDGFERWSYNESTSSLFTHQAFYDTEDKYVQNQLRLEGGHLGANPYQITPFPKYISGSHGTGEYKLHHTTSSLGAAWFTGLESSASFYDNENNNALVRTIPEHIRLDSNNSQYELFVNMIGHHFDILYSHADALAKTYHPIEHPKLGHSKETLYEIAKSLGWTLINGKQASSLWQYKLGVNSSGSFQSTGSIFSKADEGITKEVWRRIVNNLPYLLKSKGTARSVKALMNTYGIPQTLLSIREYGGPKVAGDVPTLIEDRFTYALQFNSGSHINWIDDFHNTNIGNWGFQREGLSSGADIPIQTREWRFKPYSGSTMLLWSNSYTTVGDDRIQSHVAIEHTGSYSGSSKYGRIHLVHGRAADTLIPMSSSTEWLPLYDGNFWNVRYYFTATGTGAGTYNEQDNLNTTYHVQVQQASDYITGKIVHSGSLSVTPTDSSHRRSWSATGESRRAFLGGCTGSTSNGNQRKVNTYLYYALNNTTGGGDDNPGCGTFSGSIQEYKEWLEDIGQESFNYHTLNPTSYVSGLHPTASYDTLVRHYPLGTDLIAIDRSTGDGLIVSSSHPNQSIKDFTDPLGDGHNTYATASGFSTPSNSERGNYEPVEETYYVQGISLGGNNPRSQKIRFDDNTLIRQLSRTNTAERSKFDYAPIDSPKLGLFYSMADQINKDIYNNVGDAELDDYIGDPDDEYEMDYPDLLHFSKKYWKKYTNRNDINAYMRIFSQFDFGLFHQLKQLLPERVDEASGLLVEPNALERTKVRLTKKPSYETLHYEAQLPTPKPSGSGDYNTYMGAVDGQLVSVESDSVFSATNNYTGVISTFGSGSPDYFAKEVFPADETPFASGSRIAAYTAIKPGNQNNHWQNWKPAKLDKNDNLYIRSEDVDTDMPHTDKLRVQFNTYCRYDTIRDLHFDIGHKDAQTSGTSSLYCRVLTTPDNIHGEHNKDNDGTRHIVSESGDMVGRTLADQHSTITYSGTTEQTDRFTFKDVHIQERTNITVEFYWKWVAEAQHIYVDRINMIQSMKKVGYSAIIPSIDTPRPSNIFNKRINHYSTGSSTGNKFERNEQRALSQSMDSWYSQSLGDVGYRDDECVQLDNLRFNGSQITCPGINQSSANMNIGYSPVVQVWQVNPNQVVFTQNPDVNLQVAPAANPSNLLIVGPAATIKDIPAAPINPQLYF